MSALLPESYQRGGYRWCRFHRRCRGAAPLADTNAQVFNLDKCNYASDLTNIALVLKTLGPEAEGRHQLLRVDLANAEATAETVRQTDPDLVLHLAAESHVDRSIAGPGAFISSNVNGTFICCKRCAATGRRHRSRGAPISVSITSVLMRCSDRSGQMDASRRPPPTTPAAPTASKAASDHLVRAWHHTYGLPVVLTNCSNNYGPGSTRRS